MPDVRPVTDLGETMSSKLSIVYYSATGNVYRLAKAIEEGALEAGAQVRLRRVAELVPESVISQNPDWVAHRAETAHVPEATPDDLDWADGLVFGTPTRFGNVSSQLKQFIDGTSELWGEGRLADKAVSGFVSSHEQHGGQESTLLSLYNVFIHWGSIIVPPGYTDESVFASGGNPYGIGSIGAPDEADLEVARFQGRRMAEKARMLAPALVS